MSSFGPCPRRGRRRWINRQLKGAALLDAVRASRRDRDDAHPADGRVCRRFADDHADAIAESTVTRSSSTPPAKGSRIVDALIGQTIGDSHERLHRFREIGAPSTLLSRTVEIRRPTA